MYQRLVVYIQSTNFNTVLVKTNFLPLAFKIAQSVDYQ